ncbi:MAG: chemotaxis protein [Proteobacteria bacterium]|nr:chemotaxis protein [Pseudomonadota bacterium]MBU1689072.1 chemotaxis protein [Pseudomonadota bacterium]
MNVMANSFQKLLSEIAGATEKVNLSSMEISSTVEEQSFIASTEVSSIAEISATVEELTASSKQIAHSSRKVAQAAGDSLSKTDQGAVSIGHLVGEINVTLLDIEENRNRIIELKNKSEEIGDIMKIINSVVDQTKLISFNASIEASMAGETGKRFRVVAEKIRSLADSVMESTEKIENRIGEIQDSVQSLVISSDSSTEKMKKVASSSKVAEELLREIYQEARTNVKLGRQILTATQQQETASNQVAAAIREIMVGVEENSTALNQTAKITRDMVKLSKNLEGIMISE